MTENIHDRFRRRVGSIHHPNLLQKKLHMNARDKASILYSPDLTVPDAGLELGELDVPVDGVPSEDAFSTTYISPVASELTKSRPWLSNVIPTGLKHFWGQTELSAFQRTSVTAVLLSGAAIGSPSRKGSIESL